MKGLEKVEKTGRTCMYFTSYYLYNRNSIHFRTNHRVQVWSLVKISDKFSTN